MRTETCRQFSQTVDESIRQACCAALSTVFRQEIGKVRCAAEKDASSFEPLPADILFLGGDDLLVAVPADRALEFALQVTEEFERLTREKIDTMQDTEAQQFFRQRLCDQGFTISCGVAIAKSSYPFYLSLDLAEQLLKKAKQSDSSRAGTKGPHVAARIDFHVVAGANGHTLQHARDDDYRTATDAKRTLRPLSPAQLKLLRAGVQDLRQARFPRSKLHELQEAALMPQASRADWRMREVFVRCRYTKDSPHRCALWQSLHNLCPEEYEFIFPWFTKGEQRLLGVADLVEAYDLFPARQET